MKKFYFKSYCKINLYLKVLKKLKSGYHIIESLATFVNIYDVIALSETKNFKDKIIFYGKFAKGINFKSNTITKCLNLLRANGNLKDKFFEVSIKKNTPHGSGLGAGSANAAYFLNFLNIRYKLNLSKKKLSTLATKIGDDVELCLIRKTSYIDGINKTIKRLNRKLSLNLLIVFPNIKCSTKKIYLSNKIYSQHDKFIFNKLKSKKKIINFLKVHPNDLQKTVTKKYKIVKKLINFISNQKKCYFARVTGSGSACFGVFPNFKSTKAAKTLIKKKFPKYWSVVSKTI
jgi:4-diphosphocytidyl-2-C-methyl-D-erythritol kinase